MSEADREQRQRLIDEYYDHRQDRDLRRPAGSRPRFDDLVNDQPILLAEDALAKGLVDTLARWDAVEDVVKALEGRIEEPGQAGPLAAGLAAPGPRLARGLRARGHRGEIVPE